MTTKPWQQPRKRPRVQEPLRIPVPQPPPYDYTREPEDKDKAEKKGGVLTIDL